MRSNGAESSKLYRHKPLHTSYSYSGHQNDCLSRRRGFFWSCFGFLSFRPNFFSITVGASGQLYTCRTFMDRVCLQSKLDWAAKKKLMITSLRGKCSHGKKVSKFFVHLHETATAISAIREISRTGRHFVFSCSSFE